MTRTPRRKYVLIERRSADHLLMTFQIAICYLVILFVDISVFLGTGIMLHHILKDAERDAGRNAVDVQPAHMGLAASVVDGVSRSASTLIVETKA